MSLTIHVYCNGIEHGNIEVVYGETNESLKEKITSELGIEDFMFEDDFDVYVLCQNDNIYIEYDKVIEAKRDVKGYMNNNTLEELIDDRVFVQALVISNEINIIKDKNGSTSLHWASQKGHNDVVKTLIEADAGVNIINNYGYTSLHLASIYGHNNVVKTLIEASVNVNIKNSKGCTSLYLTSLYGYNDVVKTLIDAGADVNIKNNNEQTSLCVASRNGYNDVVKTLTENGADVNTYDISGNTPLHMASSRNHINVAETLISIGANIYIRNNRNKTPLRIAIDTQNYDIVDTLSMTEYEVMVNGPWYYRVTYCFMYTLNILCYNKRYYSHGWMQVIYR